MASDCGTKRSITASDSTLVPAALLVARALRMARPLICCPQKSPVDATASSAQTLHDCKLERPPFGTCRTGSALWCVRVPRQQFRVLVSCVRARRHLVHPGEHRAGLLFQDDGTVGAGSDVPPMTCVRTYLLLLLLFSLRIASAGVRRLAAMQLGGFFADAGQKG